MVRGGGSCAEPALLPAAAAASACSRAAASAGASASSSGGPHGDDQVVGPGVGRRVEAHAAQQSRFSSVPIATWAAATPSTAATSRLTCIRVTESW